jgi:hypothetical protein
VITGEFDMAHGTDSDPDRATETVRCREFRLSDAMVLIAGAALALSGGAHLLVLLAGEFARLCGEAAAHREDLIAHWPIFWRVTHDHLRNTLWYGFQAAVMVLLGMTPAFLVLRLRRPRPPLRALLRQPGTVAALSMVFGLFWGTGFLVYLFPDKVDAMTAAPAAIGVAVAAGWGALALSRRWEPEPGWVDRMGRALGCAAIGTALIGLLIFRI